MTTDTPISAYEWWYGRDEPPLEPRPLRAGPVTASLVGRDLRNVRYGGIEVALLVLVANLTPEPREVTIDALAGREVGLRRLHAETALEAVFEPGQFRSRSERSSAEGVLTLNLEPFEVVRVSGVSRAGGF